MGHWQQGTQGFWLGTTSGIVLGLISMIIVRSMGMLIKKNRPVKVHVDVCVTAGVEIRDSLPILKKQLDVVQELPILGVGGVATVYKGTLAAGWHVAIKRIPIESCTSDIALERHSSWWSTHSQTNFNSSSYLVGNHHAKTEMVTLAKIRHTNLSRMYAYSRVPDAHLLVYQFAENGSLKDALDNVRQGKMNICWSKRKNIALGIAMGLKYLHFDCTPRILHRDLKTSNVLLDSDFAAHLSDFGLARELADDLTHLTMSKIAGTVGYYAPEYANTAKFTKASDVYSMGVIFAVLLCGKEPRDEFFADVEGGMIGWINYLLATGQEHRGIDATMYDKEHMEEIKLLMRIVCYCTKNRPHNRPSSNDIVQLLKPSYKPTISMEELLLTEEPSLSSRVSEDSV